MNDRVENTPLNDLETWRLGESVSARKLNQGVSAINALRRGVRPPRQVVQPRGGTGEGKVGSPIVEVFLTGVVTGDGVMCRKHLNSDETFEVARPYHLRITPFDQQTIAGRTYNFEISGETGALTRIVSLEIDGRTISERQFIQPVYRADAPILVMALPGGEEGQGHWSGLTDLNVDARRWMREWTAWG